MICRIWISMATSNTKLLRIQYINNTFKKQAIIRNTRLKRDRNNTEKKKTEEIAMKKKLRDTVTLLNILIRSSYNDD